MGRQSLHDISVEFKAETAKAIMYTDGVNDFWVPKSSMGPDGMIQVEGNRDGSITLTAPEWWLHDRGLI